METSTNGNHNLWFLCVCRGFAEFFPRFFEGGKAGREKSRKKPGKTEAHTQKTWLSFFGEPKNQENMEGFSPRQGGTAFFLGGTPKKNAAGSRKTFHIPRVFHPQRGFSTTRPITKPPQKR